MHTHMTLALVNKQFSYASVERLLIDNCRNLQLNIVSAPVILRIGVYKLC
jgi:hypothetical protein